MTLSISCNRASIVSGCVVWSFLLPGARVHEGSGDPGSGEPYMTGTRILLFSLVVVIGIFERLSGVANMVSMERDWVPTVIAASTTSQSERTLTQLNAVMRRIDLVCKLISPLVISGFIEATSTVAGVIFVGVLSGICWPIEMLLARHVWSSNEHLRAQKDVPVETPAIGSDGALVKRAAEAYQSQLRQARQYLESDVWPASFALTLLHLSALSYAASFMTFMLNEGFSLLVVTVARALGSIVEVSSTFLAPVGIKKLARCRGCPIIENDAHSGAYEEHFPGRQGRAKMNDQHDIGLARSGLWGLTLQFTCLIPVVLAIFQIAHGSSSGPITTATFGTFADLLPGAKTSLTLFSAVALFLPLSFSRLGLWVFDLTTQELAQTHVSPAQRSSFAGTETALTSFFELLQWVAAAVWNKPEEFRWLAVGSLGAVGVSLVIYSGWVRRRRGHLVHLGRLRGVLGGCAKSER